LIRNQKLTYKMLTTWPIFKEMRKDGRYNQYKKKTTKSGSRRRTKTKKVASS